MRAAVGLLAASCAAMLAGQDRAQEILARARDAIGGQARLDAVRSLSAKGSGTLHSSVWLRTPTSTTKVDDQVIRMKLEIAILLPNRFLLTRKLPGIEWQTGVNERASFDTGSPNYYASVPDGLMRVRAPGVRRAEFLRCTLALLLTAPQSGDVRFVDGGTAEIDGEQTDVAVAKGANDFAARLFFNRQSRLVMIADEDPRPRPHTATQATAADEPLFTRIQAAEDQGMRMRLADYRADDGIVFPHRITIESAGRLREEWEISRFKVNPSLDPRHFEPWRR